MELDAAAGEVLATLERLKLADNTLVIISSDNGGVMDDGYLDHAFVGASDSGAMDSGRECIHQCPRTSGLRGNLKPDGSP